MNVLILILAIALICFAVAVGFWMLDKLGPPPGIDASFPWALLIWIVKAFLVIVAIYALFALFRGGSFNFHFGRFL